MPLRRLARRLPAPLRRRLRVLFPRRPASQGSATSGWARLVWGREPSPTSRTPTLALHLAPAPPMAPEHARIDPGTIMLRATAKMYVPRMLVERGLGGYEPHALNCFLAMVEIAPPGAVLDIGANVGIYGHLAAAYSDRDVHLFEPTPEVADVAATALTRPGARYTVVQSAVGAEEGTARLYLSDRTDSSNSLNASFRPHTRHLDVPLIRLDDYVRRAGIVPAVVKIDTETTEPDVLAGSAEVLRVHRPWLMVEVLAGRVEERLEAVLAPCDYVYYHLDGPGPLDPVPRIVGDATSEHLMYLLLPEPASPRLWDRMRAWQGVLAAGAVVPTSH